MKKLLKPFALLLSALLTVSCLTACGEEPTSPEAFMEKMDAASETDSSSDAAANGINRISVSIALEAMGETMNASIVAESCGNITHTTSSSTGLGVSESSETYTVTEGTNQTVYTKNGSSWSSETTTAESNNELTDWEGFDLLFKDENYEYNSEKSCYVLKEGLAFDVFGFHVVGAQGVYNENSCEIVATLEQDMNGVSMTGTMTVTVDLSIKGTITLPTV